MTPWTCYGVFCWMRKSWFRVVGDNVAWNALEIVSSLIINHTSTTIEFMALLGGLFKHALSLNFKFVLTIWAMHLPIKVCLHQIWGMVWSIGGLCDPLGCPHKPLEVSIGHLKYVYIMGVPMYYWRFELQIWSLVSPLGVYLAKLSFSFIHLGVCIDPFETLIDPLEVWLIH